MGFNKLFFIKKNKKTSYIQDGIVKYTIFLKGFPKCICMKDNNLCKHINYYFSDIIGLEQWKINMLESKIYKAHQFSKIKLTADGL